MRFNEAMVINEVCRKANEICGVRVVPHYQGGGGVGKSAFQTQYGLAYDRGVIAMFLAQSEPTDVKGSPYPDIEARRTRYLLPEDLPTADLTLLGVVIELAMAADMDLEEVFGIVAKPAGEGEAFKGPFGLAVKNEMGDSRVRRAAIRRAETHVYESLEQGGVRGLDRLKIAIANDPDADHEGFRQEWERIQGRFPEGTIHLDELNRAADDTKQAAFSLLNEGRIGNYILPLGWHVVVSGNYDESSSFTLNRFEDEAWHDRFVYLDWSIGPNERDDWCVHVGGRYGEAASTAISAVLSGEMSMFVQTKGTPPQVKPSPRSWEKVIAVDIARQTTQAYMDLPVEEQNAVFQKMLQGIVGIDAAKTYKVEGLPVKASQIVKDGVDAHKAGLEKMKTERGQILALMGGISSIVRSQMPEVGFDENRHLTDEGQRISTNVLDFAEWMAKNLRRNRDIIVAFLRGIIEAAASQNTSMNTHVLFNSAVGDLIRSVRARAQVVTKQDFMDMLMERTKLADAVSILVGTKEKGAA